MSAPRPARTAPDGSGRAVMSGAREAALHGGGQDGQVGVGQAPVQPDDLAGVLARAGGVGERKGGWGGREQQKETERGDGWMPLRLAMSRSVGSTAARPSGWLRQDGWRKKFCMSTMTRAVMAGGW